VSLPPLCKALALFNLLDDLEAPETGMPLRVVQRHWPQTGLRNEDLEEILSIANATGEFELIQANDGPRIKATGFEQKRLNPCTLTEIEALSRAFRTLRNIRQRQPRGQSYGRRMVDAM
jgi:hypothetical protein